MDMDVKNLEIKRNRCDCHPEDCSCDDWNLVYQGEVLARHLFREKLEKLLTMIQQLKNENENLKEQRDIAIRILDHCLPGWKERVQSAIDEVKGS